MWVFTWKSKILTWKDICTLMIIAGLFTTAKIWKQPGVHWRLDKDVIICNGIPFGHKKRSNLTICDNMDGPRGHYAKWNKSDRERHIPYDFTYIWHLNNKINKQKEQKQTRGYREQTDSGQMGGRLGKWTEKLKGIRKYKLPIIKMVIGCKV